MFSIPPIDSNSLLVLQQCLSDFYRLWCVTRTTRFATAYPFPIPGEPGSDANQARDIARLGDAFYSAALAALEQEGGDL